MSGLPSLTISHTSRKGGQPNRSAAPVGSGATRSRQVDKKAEIGGTNLSRTSRPDRIGGVIPLTQ